MSLSYSESVQWYYEFARFDYHVPRSSDQAKLERMEHIVAALDNPHQKFPSVLIAGTKGKGSTAALLESILRTAGYRTGLFTSPHLSIFRERIRVNGAMIGEDEVIDRTQRLQALAAQFPGSTFFEWVTALAFTYFAAHQVEIAMIEVGLGGRLDCTNVLQPRVSVITPISFDHMDILGNTLEKIAREKAGIIKPHTPIVSALQEPDALTVIRATAAEKTAPLTYAPDARQIEPVQVVPDGQIVEVQTRGAQSWTTYDLPLLGPHQRVNLATALAVIESLRAQNWQIPADALTLGISRVQWPARFEVLQQPDASIVPYIVADGAHNRASAHELVRTLDEVFPGRPVHFVFGASTDKDIAGMLAELAPRAVSIVFTQSHHARAASPAMLAQLASAYPVETHLAPTVADALAQLEAQAAPHAVLCVTGSLFIAGEAREFIYNRSYADRHHRSPALG